MLGGHVILERSRESILGHPPLCNAGFLPRRRNILPALNHIERIPHPRLYSQIFRWCPTRRAVRFPLPHMLPACLPPWH